MPRDCHTEWSQSERGKQISCPGLIPLNAHCVSSQGSEGTQPYTKHPSWRSSRTFIQWWHDAEEKGKDRVGELGTRGDSEAWWDTKWLTSSHMHVWISGRRELWECQGIGAWGNLFSILQRPRMMGLLIYLELLSTLLEQKEWGRESRKLKEEKRKKTYGFIPWFGSAVIETIRTQRISKLPDSDYFLVLHPGQLPI